MFDNEECRIDADDLGDDLSRAFGDARVSFGRPENEDGESAGKRKRAEKIFLNIGEEVTYRKHRAKVIYGPFERASRQLYEVQLDTGVVMTAHARSLGLLNTPKAEEVATD